MHYPFLFLFIIGLMFLTTTDACGKRPSRRTTTPSYSSTTMVDNTTEPTTTPSTYRLPCNATEDQLMSCLHGGSCFVVVINKERNRNCQCPAERTGSRCQELSPEFFRPTVIDKKKLRTAHIAAGVVGTVIIVLVIVSSVYLYYRVKQKERGIPHRHRQNGANSTQPNNGSNHATTDMELQQLRPSV